MEEHQPRYRAYLLHTDNFDRPAWEYMLWVNQKWREWRKIQQLGRLDRITDVQHEQFTQWLFETVPEGQLTLF